MSGGEGRKISTDDLQMVHNRIEQCLSNYMTQKEVVKALYTQHNIEPRFTELVWEQLERQNPEFFKEYYLRLKVKEQILEFNRLLSKQAELMCLPGPSGIASVAMSNGSKMPSVGRNLSPCCIVENGGPALKPEDMRLQNSATLANVYNNGGSSAHSGMQGAVDLSSHGRNIDVSGNMLLAPNLDEGTACRMGSGIVKSELSLPGYSAYKFGAHNHLMGSHPVLCDASVASFSRMELDSQNLNGTVNPLDGTLLDIDPSSFGYIGHVDQNYGFSDLGAEFSNIYWRATLGLPSWHQIQAIFLTPLVWVRTKETLQVQISQGKASHIKNMGMTSSYFVGAFKYRLASCRVQIVISVPARCFQ